MSADQSLIEALKQALEKDPSNIPVRKHLADLLLANQYYFEAEGAYREVLAVQPDNIEVKLALARTFYEQKKWMMALVVFEGLVKETSPPADMFLMAAQAYLHVGQTNDAAEAYNHACELDPSLADNSLAAAFGVDGQSHAQQTTFPDEDTHVKLMVEGDKAVPAIDVRKSQVTFEDVGGMDKLKEEIRIKIIHPLEKPDLYTAYGKSIGGGILMYGPPGCGKTHLARATAGEVEAYFLSIGIHDVLNMYLGQSELNLHHLFQMARHYQPCVLFIDEVDALGASRGDMRQSAGRHTINQLLAELDGINASNQGVLVLAATNAPWHLDSALRRPGRFDRIIFVPPPDVQGRAAILSLLLKDKPTDDINVHQLAKKTSGFSGADLKGLVEIAVEHKLRAAMKLGRPVPLQTNDLLQALSEIKPSTKDWFATARNYAMYANEHGLYDDVLSYINDEDGSNLLSSMTFWRNK